ncbi:hypothetical protein HDU97_006786 [Phlyctochytrium planicorne]|nr:hypothetical protein HDU97_006786 [Phlyctochytrium planicorne]
MFGDLQILGGLYERKVNAPSHFPENSLKAMRILFALQKRQPEKLVDASRQFWTLYWHDGKSLQSDADLLEYLSPVVTKELAQQYITEYAVSPEVKEGLIAVTKALVEDEGAFGAPWFIVEREDGEKACFFGSDRMEAVAYFLKKPYLGPVPGKARL